MSEELQRKYDMLTQSAEYWIGRAARAEADRDRLAAEVAGLTTELDEYRNAAAANDDLMQTAHEFHEALTAMTVDRDRLRAALEAVGEELAPWSMAQTGSGIYHHAIYAGMIARTALATPAQEGQG